MNLINLAKEAMKRAMTGPGSWSAVHGKHGQHNPSAPAYRALSKDVDGSRLEAAQKNEVLDKAWQELVESGELHQSGEIRHKHNKKVVSRFYSATK